MEPIKEDAYWPGDAPTLSYLVLTYLLQNVLHLQIGVSGYSELSVLQDSPTPFDEDRFRFHSYEDFQANCDLKGDLCDVVGHMKLVNGQSLTEPPVLDEVEIAKARHLLVHVQSHDGLVMKLYLWDQAARDFFKKIKTYSCPDLKCPPHVFYGLRCPAYHRLLRLVVL